MDQSRSWGRSRKRALSPHSLIHNHGLMASINIIANITSVPCLRAVPQLYGGKKYRYRKMRGDEIEPNWDHPQKHIVGVQAGIASSSPAFQSYSALWRPPGKTLASQGMWCQYVCVCVCVRENFLYAAQIAGERAESFLHMLVAASAFKDWAPTHQTQPARRNEIPIIFN